MPENPASEAALARSLMRGCDTAALATLSLEGAPFASHIITAPAPDLSPLALLSRLAVHSQNLARDPRASLLFVREAASDNMAASRLTLTGRLLPDTDPEMKRIFLSRHPGAARYAGFTDFSFYRFHVEAGHLVAGFGRIVDLGAAELTTPSEGG